jgi:hypothetical protein
MMRAQPIAAARATAQSSMARPPTSCSTFGVSERMRTPLPAAKMIAARAFPMM